MRLQSHVLAIVLLLIGCTSASSTPTQTEPPAPSLTATESPIPSITPTPDTAITTAPTIHRTPNIPDDLPDTPTSGVPNTREPINTPAPPADFFDTFLFQGTQYPACKLPCWRDLIVGESTLEQVQFVLQNAFHLDLTPYPFTFEQTLLHLGYSWSFEEPESPLFGMDFWIEEETQTLHTIDFWWTDDVRTGVSPQRIIQEFGAPDQWWFEAETFMGQRFESAMVYRNGLIFLHGLSQSGYDQSTGEFCLESDQFYSSAVISNPTENYMSELPDLVEYLARVGSSPRVTTETTIEEFTGYSIAEMTDLALNSPQPCIEFSYQ